MPRKIEIKIILLYIKYLFPNYKIQQKEIINYSCIKLLSITFFEIENDLFLPVF